MRKALVIENPCLVVLAGLVILFTAMGSAQAMEEEPERGILYNCTATGDLPALIEVDSTSSAYPWVTTDTFHSVGNPTRGDITMTTGTTSDCGNIYGTSTADSTNYPTASTWQPFNADIIGSNNLRTPNSAYAKDTQPAPGKKYKNNKQIDNGGPCVLKDSSAGTHYFIKTCLQTVS